MPFSNHSVASWNLSNTPAKIVEQPSSLDFSSNIRLLGKDSELAFDRVSGDLCRGVVGGHPVLLARPDLHVLINTAALTKYPGGWHLTKSSYRTEERTAVLEWTGDYASEFTGGFTIRMDDANHVEVAYHFRHTGAELTAREIGLSLSVPSQCGTLNWDRKAEFSYYPTEEIGRTIGTATIHSKIPQLTPPGERPFSQDDHVWGCNDFRSTKRNIYSASLRDGSGAGIKVISDGSQSIRATAEPHGISLHILDYYGGSATGTGEWDNTYGVGKVIRTGDVLEGKVRLELLSPSMPEKK